VTFPVNPHEEPGMLPMEFARLQEELQKRNSELAALNAALRESEQRLEQRVEERTRELSTVLRVSHNLTTTLELEPLLGLILDQLREVVEYRLACVCSLEDDVLVLLEQRGSDVPMVDERENLSDHPNTLKMLQAGKPAIVPDLNADTYLAGRVRGNIMKRGKEDVYEGSNSWMSIPLIAREQPVGVLVLTHEEVNYYTPARAELAMAFANYAAIPIENARLFVTEQRRAEQFRVISEVGQHITSLMAVDDLLFRTERLIRENFGYYYISIGLVEGDELIVKTDCPCDRPRLKIGEEGIMGWVAAHGQTLIAPDTRQDPRYISTVSSTRTLSELALPIRWKDQIIGVLNVESDRINAFDASDVAVLEALANQLAVAIENARLYEQARQLAALEERQKLARELHDSVSQALYGIVLGARTARTLLDRDPTQASQPLDYILQLSEAGLAEMRALIFELRPESLRTEGLVAALVKLVNALGARYQLQVTIAAGDEPDVSIDVKESLYRITQEAMNNIAKHARAQRVDVKLAKENGNLILNISDDGAGFDTSAEFPGHLGMYTMRERAEKVGGTFTIESAPDKGTRIQVTIPL
jgi:signal transduction histidine kinase